MMLDKGQIKDWDGEPEDEPKAAAPKAVKEAVEPTKEAPPAANTVAANDTAPMTPEQAFARKRRGQWLALGLFTFVILLFVLTMTKIGGNIVNWGSTYDKDAREMERAQ